MFRNKKLWFKITVRKMTETQSWKITGWTYKDGSWLIPLARGTSALHFLLPTTICFFLNSFCSMCCKKVRGANLAGVWSVTSSSNGLSTTFSFGGSQKTAQEMRTFSLLTRPRCNTLLYLPLLSISRVSPTWTINVSGMHSAVIQRSSFNTCILVCTNVLRCFNLDRNDWFWGGIWHYLTIVDLTILKMLFNFYEYILKLKGMLVDLQIVH